MSAARNAESSPVALDVPADGQSLGDRHSSIGRAFKRLKIAFRKIGASSKESTPSPLPSSPQLQPQSQTQPPIVVEDPIETLIVDDEPEDVTQTAEDMSRRLVYEHTAG
jgi:hypothetical protein